MREATTENITVRLGSIKIITNTIQEAHKNHNSINDVKKIFLKNKEIRNRLYDFREIKHLFLISISSWWSMLLIAFSTVDWPSLCGLEWYFAFLSTVCTSSFMHCSWPVKVSISHFLHFFFIVYTPIKKKDVQALKNATPN